MHGKKDDNNDNNNNNNRNNINFIELIIKLHTRTWEPAGSYQAFEEGLREGKKRKAQIINK